MSEHHYFLQIEVAGLGARVALNGCAVVEAWDGAGRIVETHATPWILAGKNRLTVALARLPEGLSDEPPAFAIALHRVHDRGEPWPGSRLCAFQWTENEASVGAELATVLAHSFTADAALGSWDAEHTEPYSEPERQAVLDLTMLLNSALATRDLRRFAELSALKWTEIAMALQRPREELVAEWYEELSALLSEDDFTVSPLAAAELSITTEAGGHLVHVQRSGQRPAILGKAAGKPFALSVTLSKRRGAWRVVR